MNGALVSADRGGVFDMSLQAPIARPRLRERRCDVQETDPPAVATRSTARVAFRRRGEHLRPLPRAASQLKCGGVGDFPAEDLNAGSMARSMTSPLLAASMRIARIELARDGACRSWR